MGPVLNPSRTNCGPPFLGTNYLELVRDTFFSSEWVKELYTSTQKTSFGGKIKVLYVYVPDEESHGLSFEIKHTRYYENQNVIPTILG